MGKFGVFVGQPSRCRLWVVLMAVLAMLSPVGAISTAQAVTRSTLSLSAPSSAESRLSFAVSGYVRPARAGQVVVVQRRSGSSWLVAGRARQSSTGRYSVRVSAPSAGRFTYRAVAFAWRGAPTVLSPHRVVSVHAPYILLTPSTAVSAQTVKATGKLPGAYSRPVWVQRKFPARWVTVAKTTTSRTGFYTTSFRAPARGSYLVRTLAPRVTVARKVRAQYVTSARTLKVVTALAWSARRQIAPNFSPSSVSCPSVSFCAAVDSNGKAVTFNGTSWSAPKVVAPVLSLLISVSCPSASFCVAIGLDGSAVTFDGTSWSVPKLVDPYLLSVSCASASFCVAIDFEGNAMTFDGTSWSAARLTAPGLKLVSVSCPSASFCAAVDFYGRVVTFNGTAWSAPKRLAPANSFTPESVSCPSASFCAVVDFGGRAVTFNGRSWSAPELIAPNLSTAWVSCPAASFCVAVDRSGKAVTFNGTAWSAPRPVAPGLSGGPVSCPTVSFCVAVDPAGNYVTGKKR